MRLNKNYFYTIREDINDEDTISGKLLVKAGMIKKNSSGVYMFLPLGLKVLNNIENIIRKNMNNIESSEVLMPVLIPEEIYNKSGRLNAFGKDVFSSVDRYDKKYILGPTHEELFSLASTYYVKSYKDLPFSLYQIQTKFRDELRPRGGLLRTREFIMKDAYTFDANKESMDESYNKFYNAYKSIFDELGLKYYIVRSDTGVMGGELSEEFQAVSENGEDISVICEECGYSSNTDIAEVIYNEQTNNEEKLNKELIHTPNIKTIDEISEFTHCATEKFVKTLIYNIDSQLYAVLVMGNDTVNEVKLRKLLNAKSVTLATEEEVKEVTHAVVGFAGPIDLDIKIISDNKIKGISNFCVGANKTDYHYINVNLNDFKVDKYSDISVIKEGDICPICKKPLKFIKTIEVGNCFKLGTKYSEAFNLTYKDENNIDNPVIMGSYGIGVARTLSSIVEQSHDTNGIIWPISVAPYKIVIVPVNIKDEEQNELANNLYNELTKANIEVLLDNRDERVGVKFKDMDLIGIPLRIVVGRDASKGLVEYKLRTQTESKLISIDKLKEEIQTLLY
ncbi:MAG: proline--tRNA ligase [Bacilli bacterium]